MTTLYELTLRVEHAVTFRLRQVPTARERAHTGMGMPATSRYPPGFRLDVLRLGAVP